jgi:hypothetical protein
MGMLGLGAADVAGGTLSNPLDFAGMPDTKSVLDHNTVPYPEESESVRRSVIDAMMGRVNEDYGKATDQANSDLIAAGIRPGSKAYGDRMQMIERSRNDAKSQAELTAGSEVARQFGMDLSRAQQIQGAQQQGFGQGMDTRRQAITEALAKRTQPLNEISAFRSGSQISPLQFPGVSPTQVAPAPLFGAAQAQYGAAGDMYNAQAQQSQGLQNGLFSLGAAALPLLFSDRRLKSNVVRVGTHRLGIGVYDYDIFGGRQRGVMADEVLTVIPQAVVEHPSGYLMVNYGLL